MFNSAARSLSFENHWALQVEVLERKSEVLKRQFIVLKDAGAELGPTLDSGLRLPYLDC